MNAHAKALIREHVGEEKWNLGKIRAAKLVLDTVEAEKKQSAVQWAWGDLSLELIPITGKPGDHSLTAVLLEAFMEDYKVPWSKMTMHSLRQTASAWPKSKRKRTSFAVHKILKSNPKRFELIKNGMTAAEAMAIMGRKPSEVKTHRASAIECANAVKSWSRALQKRMAGEEPSDELKLAVREAWNILSEIAHEMGLFEEFMESMVEDS